MLFFQHCVLQEKQMGFVLADELKEEEKWTEMFMLVWLDEYSISQDTVGFLRELVTVSADILCIAWM